MGAVAWSVVGQRRTRNVQRPKATATPQIDYSKFSHATNKHQAPCNTCHKVPSKEWQKTRDFLDITDYPDHDACVGCHRRQFFKGAAPVICTICHVKASPREDARFAFRNPKDARQFNIEFPHDKHQDVIALMRRSAELAPKPLFVRASFNPSSQGASDKASSYNNCSICHKSGTRDPLPAPGGWIDGFVPDAATFKSVPMNHGSCFNCHWKSQPPVRDSCEGCHKLTQPYSARSFPVRISMKFRHAREQHVAECTTCHINITKASSLRGLKPDVPITSCTECHNKDGLRLDVAH
ncbi:MAG: hypothetical protein ACREBG_23840, partial [Pyrinomonadaceae bacterium]